MLSAASAKSRQWRFALQACRTMTDFKVLQGSTYSMEKQFCQKDVTAFLQATGDTNGIHRDEATAIKAGLEGPILPGLLCASLFPAVIAANFPGTLYLSQTLKFRTTAQVGEWLRAEVVAQQIRGQHVRFETRCFDKQKKLLVDGEALALLPGQASW